MTPYDILEAIGEVDENAVAQADRRRTNRKKVFAAVGSALAACLVLCVFIPIAAMIFRSTGAVRREVKAPRKSSFISSERTGSKAW